MGPFLMSLLYIYAPIGRDMFIDLNLWGIGILIYSAMLWVFMLYDYARYRVPLFAS